MGILYYWVLFIGIKLSLFSLSPFNSEHFTTANSYVIQKSIRKEITNSEIITTQIFSDIEISDNFTQQIIPITCIQYILKYISDQKVKGQVQ